MRRAFSAAFGSCVTIRMVLPSSRLRRSSSAEDFLARRAIEIAGRLVRDDERRIGDERARDCDALLLTAG